MSEKLELEFEVIKDFTACGQASEQVKRMLKQLSLPPSFVRRIAIAMYEGEINMVIHADGGKAFVDIGEDKIRVVLSDKGPGIKDVELAMKEGFSTADDDIRALGFGAGMGLPNMFRYSDKMDIQTVLGVGTTVSMDFFIVNED